VALRGNAKDMNEPDGMSEYDTESDHMVETPDSLRDGDPESPPTDRGSDASDRPLGAEKFGTTHAEAEEGESLDQKLAEEVPDIGAHDPVEDIVAEDPATFARDAADAQETDDNVLADAYGEQGDVGDETGRLVEPDEGAHTDVDKDMIASDVGRDGGDMSAEESAMHVEDGR